MPLPPSELPKFANDENLRDYRREFENDRLARKAKRESKLNLRPLKPLALWLGWPLSRLGMYLLRIGGHPKAQ